jgi:transposase InsO family protein
MDIKTWYTVLFMESSKDQPLKWFNEYKALIETQTGNKIKRLRTDNSGEYMNKEFKDYCSKNGIIMETMAPYSPAQNGIAE